MQRPTLMTLLAATLVSTPPLWADTEFTDTLPLDLAKALIGRTPAGPALFYSDVVDGFPAIDFPTGFEVLGSMVREVQTTVVLASSQSTSEMRDSLTEAFASAGFTEFIVPVPTIHYHGFRRVGTTPPRPLPRYCHDSEGDLTLTFLGLSGRNTVRISHAPDTNPQSCEEELQERLQRLSQYQASRGIDQYLPLLMMPAMEPRNSPYGAEMSVGGDGADYYYRARVSLDWSPQEFYEHFSPQMEEQGWQLDSVNRDEGSNSSWTLAPDPDTEIRASLRIVPVDSELTELEIRVSPTGMLAPDGSLLLPD